MYMMWNNRFLQSFSSALLFSLPPSHSVQSLREVLPKVLKVLDPTSISDERILYAYLRPLLGSLVPVGHDRGLLDEGLDSAEGGGNVRQLDAVDDLGSLPQVSVNLKAHNSPVPPHLVLRVLVVGVRGESGVVDNLDLWVRLQRLREPHSVLVLPRDSKLQGLHAPEEEVRGVGVHDASEDVLHVLHLVHDLLAARDVPAEHVVVAGHVLGPR
mmetsp:Transcript_13523/g.38003  ORF Transcript_13523/g.38003 Transcript_13523/m.38003 type:complete len:213 (-) Transcript_13523:979-1617(-)